MSEFTPTVALADQYFVPNNHARAADWDALDAGLKAGLLATSKRELEAYLNRQLEEPGTTEIFDSVDTSARDDWGCYEQALEISDRQVRKTTKSKVKKIGKPMEDEHWGFRISPIALNFARVPRLKIARG
jgi:hypothetical protein